MRKVKIVFFIDVLQENFDGVTNTMHQIISRMPKDKFEAIFITPLPPLSPDFPYPVYLCPYFEIPFYRDYRVALPRRMKGLKTLLSDFSPDIIHWSTPSALGWYAVGYGRKKNIPVLSIYHTHFTSYAFYYLNFIPAIQKISYPFEWLLLGLYRKTDMVLAPGTSMKRYLERIKVETDRVRVWGRGVDTMRFSPEHRDENFFSRFGLKRERKILFVSRLAKFKETDTLIKFGQMLPEAFKLVIVGDGPDRKRMQSKLPAAIFTGKLTGPDLSKAFASADVFVFTSITETFGNVVLEAMASGLPVVAARAGGPSDIIRDGETGLLVEPKDPFELLAKTEALIADEFIYNSIRQKALDYARQQSWEVLCDELYEIYVSLLNSRN